jgi:hypothetical protein
MLIMSNCAKVYFTNDRFILWDIFQEMWLSLITIHLKQKSLGNGHIDKDWREWDLFTCQVVMDLYSYSLMMFYKSIDRRSRRWDSNLRLSDVGSNKKASYSCKYFINTWFGPVWISNKFDSILGFRKLDFEFWW